MPKNVNEAPSKSIIEESAKTDLLDWLSSGKMHTATVLISNDQTLAAEMDSRIAALNEIASKLNERDPDDAAVGGLGESDELADEYDALRAEYEELALSYENTCRPFTFRATKPSDPQAIKAAMKADGADTSDRETELVYQTAHLMVEPVMTGPQLMDLSEQLGANVLAQMVQTWVPLTGLRKPVEAPLSRRP